MLGAQTAELPHGHVLPNKPLFGQSWLWWLNQLKGLSSHSVQHGHTQQPWAAAVPLRGQIQEAIKHVT